MAQGQAVKTAYLNLDQTGSWIIITGSYNEPFLKELKNVLNRSHRFWDGEKKLWLVSISKKAELLRMIANYFDTIEFLDERLMPKAKNLEDENYRMLHLLPTAPLELIKAAYRTLALIYHPDRNSGNGEKMTKLNVAYTNVMKNFK